MNRARLYLLLLVSTLASQLVAADNTEEIAARFLGDYELVSYFTFPENGEPVDMEYIGRLSYDAFGNMAGLGMPKNLPRRAETESGRVIGGFAYWGSVSYDTDRQIVIHHVEGSPMVPRWVGGDNIRYYEFAENDAILKLSLRNDQGRTTATLTWRRIE